MYYNNISAVMIITFVCEYFGSATLTGYGASSVNERANLFEVRCGATMHSHCYSATVSFYNHTLDDKTFSVSQ